MQLCNTIDKRSPWRGLTLSERMPNQGDNNSAGANIKALTNPTQVAEWVRSQALHPSKNRSNH